jgi:hypothetical protein
VSLITLLFFSRIIELTNVKLLLVEIRRSIYNFLKTIQEKTAVEPGHAVSEYARNVVALGEMKHQTAELFEPKASFRLSRNEPQSHS